MAAAPASMDVRASSGVRIPFTMTGSGVNLGEVECIQLPCRMIY